jgi:sugar/nucleoside kinase (ribokinase family)
LLPHVDYFLPNNEEAERLTGESDPVAQASAFRAAGAGTVVITCGESGATAADADGVWSCPAHRVDVVDPSGSGDAFAAGLVTGIVHRWGLPQSLQYAATLGASAASAIGTTDGVFDATAARRFMRERPLAVTAVQPRAAR